MSTEPSLEDLLRELAPQVLGMIVRRYGDFATAEDAVQEALIAAAQTWASKGVPENPRGWLLQTAGRRMIDQYRSEQSRRLREEKAFQRDVPADVVEQSDDTLKLLFLCCHPSLTPASAVALTLRAVGGLTTAEIAKAFLVPEATMAQRISRSKQRLRDASFDEPGELPSVLRVLYLMFNEGYAGSIGTDLVRVDLAAEAIRLTRSVYAGLPQDGEVAGLLALMLLTDARRPARTGSHGELVPLADQDRSLWDRQLIAEGINLVSTAMARGVVGEYQLQASIAALHDAAPSTAKTDWAQIRSLYDLLARVSGGPMVALNRAIASAMVDGPAAGLEELSEVDALLPGHYRLDAVRGHLYELLGDTSRAIEHYAAAARRTASMPEQVYLTTKAAALKR